MTERKKDGREPEEYRVGLKYGREKLEDCIEKMLRDKEKNMKIASRAFDVPRF